MNAADLEPMTRRLLESTRELTMSFAQWSMGKASEENVSDSYVKLGNEYVLARNRLAQSGIPAHDLPDVPAELRQILEQALAEEPSKAVHAMYEPRLKAVMAQLFRLLKLKQLQLAPAQSQAVNGAQPPPTSQNHHGPGQAVPPSAAPQFPPPAHTPGQSHAHAATAVRQHYPHPADASGQAARREPPAPGRERSTSQDSQGSQSSHAPQISHTGPPVQTHYRQGPVPPRGPNYRQPPHHDQAGSTSGSRSGSSTQRQRLGLPDDALAQLQNHGALERQASKRYSSHQLAQIINGSPSEKSPLPTTTVHKTSAAPDFTGRNVVRRPDAANELPPQTPEQSIHRRISMRKQRQSSLNGNNSAPASTTSSEELPGSPLESGPKQLTVFLRLDNRVRKAMLEQPPSLGAIRLRFVDVYEYIHSGATTFPDIVMQDDNTGIEYELNESTVGDIKEGTMLTLKVKSAKEQTLESEIAALREGMKEIASKLDKGLVSHGSSSSAGTKGPNFQAHQGRAYPSPVLTGDGRFKLDKPIPKQQSRNMVQNPNAVSESPSRDGAHSSLKTNQADQIQKEISMIRQTANKAVKSMQDEIVALRAELGMLRDAKVTTDVNYMADMREKLEIESQHLVVRIEDLSDIIDHQRVNVADRGVIYTPQELGNVRRELTNLTAEFVEVETFLRNEKPVLSKTWEASLNNIISSQEWYKGQEALVRDLRHDLDQCLSVVDLVQEANEKRRQRQEQNPQLRQLPPTMPPPLTKAEEEAANTAVLAEISALNLDHEQRAEAMKRAERLRRTELALRPDEFADELNQFVSDSKLKENGGFKALERLVEEREKKARLDGEKSEVLAKQNAEAIKEQRRQERQRRKAEESSQP